MCLKKTTFSFAASKNIVEKIAVDTKYTSAYNVTRYKLNIQTESENV